MEFEKNKRSKRQSVREETMSNQREEMELEEKMDKFYKLLVKIKDMKGLQRHVKPVLEPVWQPTFSLEDFDRVEGDEREREEKGKVKEKLNMERHEVENNNGLDLNLSL